MLQPGIMEEMIELLSFLMLAFPFVFVGALARELAKQTRDIRYGWWFFMLAASVLGLSWLRGYLKSEAYLAEEMWTAAAIA